MTVDPGLRGRGLAAAIELLGDRWILLLVTEMMGMDGARFNDLERSLRIPPNILSARLRRMVAAGVVDRYPDRAGRSPHAYRLTELGLALRPALHALAEWNELRVGKASC